MPHVKYRSPSIAPAYTGRLSTDPVPSMRLPAEAMEPAAAYRFIHDELMLDGSSRLNLATFVTTWMDPKPNVDGRDVRQEHDRQGRVPGHRGDRITLWAMVADLFHAENLRTTTPPPPSGVSTIGSSEAVMLRSGAEVALEGARLQE